VLAEAELAIHEERMPMPAFARADVTDDDRFSGGALAAAGTEELAELLAEVGRLVATRSRGAGSSPSR
jgi:hypothetical protein